GFSYSADHNSITVTNGSGANSIISTTFTDPAGRTLLSVGYPYANALEYTWLQYDAAGNLIYEERDSSTNGTASAWTGAAYAYDGLNRLAAKSDRDAAVTFFYYNA